MRRSRDAIEEFVLPAVSNRNTFAIPRRNKLGCDSVRKADTAKECDRLVNGRNGEFRDAAMMSLALLVEAWIWCESVVAVRLVGR